MSKISFQGRGVDLQCLSIKLCAINQTFVMLGKCTGGQFRFDISSHDNMIDTKYVPPCDVHSCVLCIQTKFSPEVQTVPEP